MNFRTQLSMILLALSLSGCFGQTDEATDVTVDGARLWGTGNCDTGDCDIYFKYWQRGGGANWATSTTVFEPRGLPPGSTWPVYADISGLEADAEYLFQFCGKEAADSTFLCTANTSSFSTLPAPQIEQFSAALSERNIVTLTWETSGGTVDEPVHIYGTFHDPMTGKRNRNVGYQSEHDNIEGLSFRVIPGLHRYTLELSTATGKVLQSVEIKVTAPTSPLISSPENAVYPKNLTDQTVSWPNLAEDEFMLIQPTKTRPPLPAIKLAAIKKTEQNNHTFTAGYLADKLGVGSHPIDYSTCVSMDEAIPAMNKDFCSTLSRSSIVIGSARFKGPRRYFAAPGGTVTLSWGSTGDSTILTAPSELGGVQSTTAFSHTFTSLPAGIHDISLESCISAPAGCANTEDVISPVSGTVVFIENQLSIALRYYFAGATAGVTVLAIIELDNGTTESVLAPVTGNIAQPEPNFQVGQHVNEGDVLMTQQTSPVPPGSMGAQIVVRNNNFERRQWDRDFAPYFPVRHDLPATSHVRLGATLALLVTDDGAIWSTGEFADGSITQITGINASEAITPLAAPLLNKRDENLERLLPVKPFEQPKLGKLSITKQEHLIEAGDYIWFVNGGSGQADPASDNNWNRIISFDRAGTDLAATLHDDRFCVYHVPMNNAGVMGIDWDERNERIVYVESRKVLDVPPVLAWFDPTELNCENFIDYSDLAAIADTTTQYCDNDSDTGCIHTIDLEDSDGSGRKLVFAAHARVDTDAVWVAGYGSSNIARVDIANRRVDVLDTDPSSVTPGTQDSFNGSGPWQFLVEDGSVYFSEFFDGDIVKLDKAALALDLSSGTYACKDTGGLDNPCMEEIHATEYIKEIHLHEDKLYFGGYSEFGYINFNDWTPGVLYTGLEGRRNPERARSRDLISGDLSVGENGMVVINDYAGRAIMRFYPKSD